MVFIHQDIVVNIADRQRAAGPDACQHLAQIALGYRIEPAFWRLPMKPHIGDEKFKVARGDVGHGVCPVFEDSLVDGLRLTTIPALARRNHPPQSSEKRRGGKTE